MPPGRLWVGLHSLFRGMHTAGVSCHGCCYLAQLVIVSMSSVASHMYNSVESPRLSWTILCQYSCAGQHLPGAVPRGQLLCSVESRLDSRLQYWVEHPVLTITG